MQAVPPCSAPSCWWQTWASGLLLCWQLQLGTLILYVCFVLFCFRYVVLWESKTPHRRTCERVSYCLETSLSQLPPQDGFPSLTLLSLFCLLYFVLPPFGENGLPFWVSGVLRQHSEVVLWKLLSIQMTFWWSVGEKLVSSSYFSAILGLPSND